MTSMAGIAALALAATTSNSPQIYPLTETEKGSGKYCSTAAAICLHIKSDDEVGLALIVEDQPPGSALRTTRLPLSKLGGASAEASGLWPYLVQFRHVAGGETEPVDGLLIGLLSTDIQSYSGGGANSTRVKLWHVNRAYGLPRFMSELLDVPYEGSVMIRACFSEKDYEERLGACHDEYAYSATLKLIQAKSGSTMPRFEYSLSARSYPWYARRSADSMSKGQLRQSDLRWAKDPECTYTRQLAYNPATLRYEFDRPAPECSDYTVP